MMIATDETPSASEEPTSNSKTWFVLGGVLVGVALIAVLGTAFIVLSSAQQQQSTAGHPQQRPNGLPLAAKQRDGLRINNPLEERLIYKKDEVNEDNETALEINGSLPFYPNHYDLMFQIPLPNAKNEYPDHYIGCVSITMRCGYPTKSFIMHASKTTKFNAVRITNITDTQEKMPHVKDVEKFEKGRNDFVKIRFETPLTPGAVYKLVINFTEDFKQDFGFMRREYVHQTGEKFFVYATFFEPDNAHEAFPCFDLPYIKTTFNVTIVRPLRLHSLSTMPIINSKPADEKGYMIDTFHKSIPMSVHSLGVFVSDFKAESSDRIKVWAPIEKLPEASYATRFTATLLRNYENFLYANYPLPKLDLTSFRKFKYGAADSYGLVVFDEEYLYLSASADEAEKALVSNFIAHEVAHQWLGNLVSLQNWNEVWLHEALATHIARVVISRIKPAWTFMDIEHSQAINELLNDEYTKKTLPAIEQLDDVDQPDDFVETMYKKGPLLMNWLNKLVGDKVFQIILAQYLRSFSDKSAGKSDFLAKVKEVTKTHKVLHYGAEFLENFLKRPGYPLITVERKYGTGIVSVRQEPFYDHKKIKQPRRTLWKIPVQYSLPGTGAGELVYLTKESEDVSIIPEDGWFIINPFGAGYYRVNYDHQNWLQLIHQLSKDPSAIFSENRAQLISDSIALANHGTLRYNMTLDVVSYMENETSPAPWFALMSDFDKLDEKMKLLDSYSEFKLFFSRLITPLLSKTTYYFKNSEPLFHTKVRPFIGRYACMYEHESCVTYSKQLFRWLYNSNDLMSLEVNHNIPYVEIGVVLCNAIRHGTEEDFQTLWNHIPPMKDILDKKELLTSILQGLSCTTSENKLWWLVEAPFKEPERYMSNMTVQHFFKAASNSRTGREIAFKYIVDNFEAFFRHPVFAVELSHNTTKLEHILRHVLIGIDNQEQLNKFHLLVAENANLIKRVRLDSPLVKISREVTEKSEWINAHSKIIKDWLQQHRDAERRRR